MSSRTSQSNAHEYRQILLNAKERILVKWITHFIRASFPVPPILAIQIAEEVCCNQFQLMHTIISYPRPIGKSWLDRFYTHHSEIKGV